MSLGFHSEKVLSMGRVNAEPAPQPARRLRTAASRARQARAADPPALRAAAARAQAVPRAYEPKGRSARNAADGPGSVASLERLLRNHARADREHLLAEVRATVADSLEKALGRWETALREAVEDAVGAATAACGDADCAGAAVEWLYARVLAPRAPLLDRLPETDGTLGADGLWPEPQGWLERNETAMVLLPARDAAGFTWVQARQALPNGTLRTRWVPVCGPPGWDMAAEAVDSAPVHYLGDYSVLCHPPESYAVDDDDDDDAPLSIHLPAVS